MSNFKKLLAIITIALLALIINFVFHKPDLAYILVVIFCGIISRIGQYQHWTDIFL